jgi:DNA-binding response OmpR family regulator
MEEATPTARPATVLVLEDDDQIRAIVARILTTAGYRVLATRDPTEAFTAAERHDARIDVILSDVMLRHARGPDVVARLRRCAPRTRIVFMSGHSRPADAPLFLPKPFLAGDLLAAIRDALGDASPEPARFADGTGPFTIPPTPDGESS